MVLKHNLLSDDYRKFYIFATLLKIIHSFIQQI